MTEGLLEHVEYSGDPRRGYLSRATHIAEFILTHTSLDEKGSRMITSMPWVDDELKRLADAFTNLNLAGLFEVSSFPVKDRSEFNEIEQQFVTDFTRRQESS